MMPKQSTEWHAKWGKDLAIRLYVLLKTAQFHEASNVALVAPLDRIMETLGLLLKQDESFSLKVSGDFLFLDDVKVKVDIENFQACMFVMEEMKKRGVGALTFSTPLTHEEIKRFIYVFTGIDSRNPSPFETLLDKLSFERVAHIQVEQLCEAEEEGFKRVLEDNREVAKRMYFKTMMAASEVMESAKLQMAAGIKKSKRMVQSMVDMVLQEESTLLGLTTLRAYDEYTYNHSVNVCILSITIGHRLGYSKRSLCELGMATLFHDIGKIEIPTEVLNKPSEFTPEEWQIMRKHPVHGVKTLLRLKGLQEQAVRMMMVTFEHHLNYDLSGYPKLMTPRKVSLYGRIATIADCYDALTSSRVYNRKAYVPDRALSYMLKKSGIAFDPILLKIFVNAIGIYPIGTLVLMNSGEMGVVMMSNPNPGKVNLPKIKLVADRSGNEVDGDLVDLSDHTGMGVSKTLDHRKYGIDVSRYFV
ncbi:MAG: HD-GYP domain-containing protein [Nitrospirae bacterium]|nr:HD-GYP domain-containing protein [Nitrospirota bacterium]